MGYIAGMPGREWDYEEVQLELWPDDASAREAPIRAASELAHRAPGKEVAKTDALGDALRALEVSRPVRITYTRNRTVILSLRPDRDGLPVLRAHQCFRTAPSLVAEAAIKLYLSPISRSERRRLTHLITSWHHESAPPPATPETKRLNPGTHHDLRAFLDTVNNTWFEGELELDITFGTRPARRLMGRHERRKPRSLIIINPILDHPWITAWYLDYLIYHECLHEVIPPRSSGSRMLVHPPEFRKRERLHPEYPRTRKYEQWIGSTAYPELLKALKTRSRP